MMGMAQGATYPDPNPRGHPAASSKELGKVRISRLSAGSTTLFNALLNNEEFQKLISSRCGCRFGWRAWQLQRPVRERLRRN